MAKLPVDDNNKPIPIVPDRTALAVTRDTSISTTTEITLNAATTFIEISAMSDGVFLRWGTGDASNSVFDEFIVAGATRHYKVPYGITALNVIDDGGSAKFICIEK